MSVRVRRPCARFFTGLKCPPLASYFLTNLTPCAQGGGSSGSASGVSERVVNQLLTELDGLESRRSVFVIAATNRPDIIDPAMLRPGRLDKLLYVPLPGPADRSSILKTLTRKTPLAEGAAEEIEKYQGHRPAKGTAVRTWPCSCERPLFLRSGRTRLHQFKSRGRTFTLHLQRYCLQCQKMISASTILCRKASSSAHQQFR